MCGGADMALIKCPECEKEISDKSEKCIGCGFPIKDFLRNQEEERTKKELETLEESEVNKKKELISDKRNVSIKHKEKIIEIYDYKLKLRFAGIGTIEDYIWNFTLEYFAISMGMSVGLAINNVSKEYTSGIVDITCNGELKEKLILFKEVMNNNGLYSGRSRIDFLYKPSEVDKRLRTKRIETSKEIAREKNISNDENFNGVYRSRLGKLEEVYCPRCGSDNCSHYQEQKIVPGKTKTRYTANLNPLKPFTLVNKKERVVRKDEIVTESKFLCNSCGMIFR